MELFIKRLKFQEGNFRVQKIKKPTPKKFLIFQEMELSLGLKNFNISDAF